LLFAACCLLFAVCCLLLAACCSLLLLLLLLLLARCCCCCCWLAAAAGSLQPAYSYLFACLFRAQISTLPFGRLPSGSTRWASSKQSKAI
jgi:hypothetical protein